MGDFDYGMEHGLWGSDGIPDWDDEYEDKYSGLKIQLTPSKYLEGKEYRERDESDSKIDETFLLYIRHDRYNANDELAIAVYHYETFIGYVRKNPSSSEYATKKEIEKLCFDEGKILDEIGLVRSQYEYILHDKGHKRSLNSLSDFEKVDRLLFHERDFPKQSSEVSTIEYALNNQDQYQFTSKEVELLNKRLLECKLKKVSKSGEKLLENSLDATEKILGSAWDLGESVVGLFRSKKK